MSGKRIKLTDIAGTDRLRSVNEVNAAQIAASIEEVGLKYPILVRWVSEGKYALVDGAHRYRAHEMLGRTEIEYDAQKLSKSEALRVEIDTNLERAELTKADRIKFIGKSDELFAQRNPYHQNGGDRKSKDFRVGELVAENPTAHLERMLGLKRLRFTRPENSIVC